MKKTIILTISLVSLLFFIGGVYIITTIKNATSELDLLIKLHRVEILREHLLLNLRKVQTDLLLINSPYALNKKKVTDNVKELNQMAVSCSDCHHTTEVQARLSNLNADIEKFVLSFARSLEIKNNMAQFEEERRNAYLLSENIIEEVNSIVHMASSKLYGKTDSSLKDISSTKTVLYIVIVVTPLVAAFLGFFALRILSKPIKLLVEATRKIKDGDLDFKITGMQDEFADLANAFNEMSAALKHYLHNTTEEEKRYRLLFESAADGIFIVHAEGENFGKIVEANPAAAKMHGYTMDELLKLNLIKDLDVPNAAKNAPERARMMLEGNWISAEIEHRRKDGSIFPVEISAGLLNFMGNKYFLAFDRDISDRKEMENQLIQAKQDWEDTFDEIIDMITIHDNNYGIIRANKAAQKLLNLQLKSPSPLKCYQYYHGKEYPPIECLSCRCFLTKEPATFETYEPHLDKYLEVRAMPRFDKDNNMIGLIHVVRDITERKKREKEFQRTEQLKIVGEWAAGLAHEIKNPLAGIKATVEMLRYEKNISSENESIVMKSINEIRRIEKLLKSLLNFAKPAKLQLSHININQLLEQTIDISLKHPLLVKDKSVEIRVEKKLSQNMPEIIADPMQLQQVFLNLMFNAIEAMPLGGVLSVTTTYNKELSNILISLKDTGKGMDESTLANIFQPFFTTKREGTGLGLAITRRLIEDHEGDISVQSVPDKGTEFKILLKTENKSKELYHG